MFPSLPSLVLDWIRRRHRLRHQATDPGLAWLSLIRIRILNFLLSRYATAPSAAAPFRPPPSEAPPEPFCIVDDPADHPPRTPPALASVLRDIRRCNLAARPRWRFWF